MAALATLFACGVFIVIHRDNLDVLSAIPFGVLDGTPRWIASQNRLLSPLLVLGVSKLGLTQAEAWQIYTAALLLAEGLLLFFLLKKSALTSLTSLKYLIVFLVSFLGLQHQWFFPWDSIDLIIFTLFAYGALNSKPVVFFLPLFFVGILNRESALFVALYLMIDAFKFDLRRLTVKLTRAANLYLGGGLLVAGSAYTKVIRDTLFQGADPEHRIIGNHVYLLLNLKDMLRDNFFDANLIHTVAVLSFVAFFTFRIRRLSDSEFKGFLMLLIILGNILVFGLFNETRMLFILLPLTLFLWLSAIGVPGTQRSASSATPIT